MSDDELLLSAFKKLLTSGDHIVWDDSENTDPGDLVEPCLEVDGSTALTVNEVHAVARFVAAEERENPSVITVVCVRTGEEVYRGPADSVIPHDVLVNGETYRSSIGEEWPPVRSGFD